MPKEKHQYPNEREKTMILNELLILKIEEGILNLIHLVKDCSRIAQGLLEDSLRIKRES